MRYTEIWTIFKSLETLCFFVYVFMSLCMYVWYEYIIYMHMSKSLRTVKAIWGLQMFFSITSWPITLKKGLLMNLEPRVMAQ